MYEYLNQFNWHASISSKGLVYACRAEYYKNELGIRKRKIVRMHREVFKNIGIDLIVDHIDGDTLNNQISNLRAATYSINNLNRENFRNKKSKYRGVSIDGNQFISIVRHNGQSMRIGRFSSELDAAIAYDNYCKENSLIHNRINFGYNNSPTEQVSE